MPTTFVVPSEAIIRDIGPSQGLNVAEFEFPCYFSFFIRRQRVNLVVPNKDAEQRIRSVFQETLFGPRQINTSDDYPDQVPLEHRADLSKELRFFRKFGDKLLQLDMLLEFSHFDSSGVCKLTRTFGETTKTVEVRLLAAACPACSAAWGRSQK